MNIDVTQVVRNLKGDPIVTGERFCQMCRQVVGSSRPLTVREALINALEAKAPNEELAFSEQMDRYFLAERVQEEDDLELASDEAAKLQGLVAKVYGPAVTGPVGILLRDVDVDRPSKASRPRQRKRSKAGSDGRGEGVPA